MGALATAPGTQGGGGDGGNVGALLAGCELSPHLLGQIWAVLSSQPWAAGDVGSLPEAVLLGPGPAGAAPKPALLGPSVCPV